MNPKFWNEVDQAVDDTVRAKLQVEIGAEAAAVLHNRHVDAWFKEKIRDIAQVMLNPQIPDDELPRWKARATALLDFYSSLTAKVAAGDRAVQRLIETEATKKEEPKEK